MSKDIETVLTPLELEVLLHYYYSKSDFPQRYLDPVRKALHKFTNTRLLVMNKLTGNDDPVFYSANMELLEPYIKQALSIPLPKSPSTVNNDFASGIDPYATEPTEFNNNVDWFAEFIKLLPTTEPITRKYCLDLAAKAKYGTVAELLQEADKIYNYLTK